MAINLFSTSGILDRGNAAFKQGYDQMGAMRTDRTNMQAGRAYAGGDRQGAARMLAQGGNINDARTLENDIQGDERQLMLDQQAAEQQTYQRGRDKTTDQAAQAERNYTTLKRITGGLRGYDEGQRLPQLQRVLPIFEQLGLPVDQFAALTEDQLNNAGLDMFEGELDKQWTFHNLGGGGIGRSNARDGTFETLREPAEKPPGNYIMGPDGNWMLNPLVGQAAAARRAPKSAGGGGVRSNIPPPPSGWRPAGQ
jgi:hypothetical protein